MRRKRKRKLKKQFKILLIAIPVAVALIALIIFAFRLQTVKVNFDLNQFTEEEVKSYMDTKKIDNTLIFWFKNKIGMSENIELFEEYSVKMNSPFQVTITACEKKFKGYIKNDKMYYYFDDTGRILKITEEKFENVPKVTGIEYDKLVLYEKIYAKNKDALSTLLNVSSAIEEYNFQTKKIKISTELEITLYIKNIQVELGTESNLDKKLLQLNDMYDNVIKYRGVLNMKRVSLDGSYTLKKTKKTKNKKK
jgi:cell division protein FtsQ